MTRRYFCWRRAFHCLEEILKEIGKEIREEIPKEIQMKIRKERDTFGEGESSLGEPSSVRKPESVSKASSLQLCLLFSEGMWNLWKFRNLPEEGRHEHGQIWHPLPSWVDRAIQHRSVQWGCGGSLALSGGKRTRFVSKLWKEAPSPSFIHMQGWTNLMQGLTNLHARIDQSYGTDGSNVRKFRWDFTNAFFQG